MTRSLTSLSVALSMLVALAVVPAVHAQGVPGFDPNKCLAKKNKCVSKKIAGLMKCRAKCQQKPDKCGAVQTACEQKVMDKFDGGANPDKGCFAKLEAKADPAKPESVCTTTGDAAVREAEIDALVAELLAKLEFSCSTAGGVAVGGYCWFLADSDESCTAECAAASLVYDEATRTYAGSDGTDARCDAVLDALGVTEPPAVAADCSGFSPVPNGCVVVPTFARFRCTAPVTSAAASAPSYRRACACQ